MKRLRRIAWNSLTTLSLVLFLATVVFAVRSHWRHDFLVFSYAPNDAPESWYGAQVDSECGQVELEIWRIPTSRAERPDTVFHLSCDSDEASSREQSGSMWENLGFGYLRTTDIGFDQRLEVTLPPGLFGNTQAGRMSVSFPHWLAILVFGVAPAAHLFQLLKARKRRRRGCCVSCGYDLRATPEQCPECGAVPVKK
ncbi:MAG TPA: hypothetical protein VH370_24005 [Humisphaera sp.]|jgi:hypothetical protein|nr:hypothetical protein [Humisphaera sp.]